MTGGQLSQFLIYAVYVAISAASLSEMWGEVQRAAGAMERLVELQERDAGDRRAAATRRRSRRRRSGRIRFENVSFRYPSRPDTLALERFVARHRSRARTSRSSARRAPARARRSSCCCASTIRCRAASLIDGVDISQAKPEDVRQRIGLVPQETVLFGTSARENIRYGRPGASDAEIEAAARAAGADAFIRQLPRGLRHVPRRARHAAVGRPAPAHRDRARVAEGSADPAARRSDQLARCGERALRAAGAGKADAASHDDHHRASARDRCSRRTASSCSITAASSRSARMRSCCETNELYARLAALQFADLSTAELAMAASGSTDHGLSAPSSASRRGARRRRR